MLKYKLFIQYLQKNDFLNANLRIRGRKNFTGDKYKDYNRVTKILYSLTDWLPSTTNLQIRMRYIVHNKTLKNIICPVCQSNKIPYDNKNLKFKLTCGLKDNAHVLYIKEVTQILAREGQLKKFDGKWAAQTEEFQSRREKTSIEKYGKKTYAETTEFRERMSHDKKQHNTKKISTNLERYGCMWATQSDEIKARNIKGTKEALILKYGVDHFTKWEGYSNFLKENKDKMLSNMKRTNQRKYQTDYIYGSAYFKKEMLSRYGVENYAQSSEFKLFMRENWPSILEKMRTTNLKKYGTEFYTQSDEFKLFMRENWPSILEKNRMTIEHLTKEYLTPKYNFDIRKFTSDYKCSETTAYKIMRELDIDYKKRVGTSIPEQEIVDFILTLDPKAEIIQNSRQIIKPKELDIYLPEYKLAIEYDGLMFHSQGYSEFSIFNTPDKDKNMHLHKTEACEAKGIQLLHIFENEWLDPKFQDIWKSVIRNKLRKNKVSYMARKCTIRRLTSVSDKELSKKFFDNNHLQGSGALGGYRYGLFYNDELVSCMTFGLSRFHKEKVFELIRFANKKGVTVMGGASKLFKAFDREHGTPKIMSYANRRWSDGGLYHQLKFAHQHISLPNYFYFTPGENILKSRNMYQKHKLSNKLKVFDPNLTEQQNCFKDGLRRIFDSGNHVFLREGESHAY